MTGGGFSVRASQAIRLVRSACRRPVPKDPASVVRESTAVEVFADGASILPDRKLASLGEGLTCGL